MSASHKFCIGNPNRVLDRARAQGLVIEVPDFFGLSAAEAGAAPPGRAARVR